MGFGDFSLIEFAVMFTIFGAFLVFLGLYVMLRKRQGHRNRRKFAKKQLMMEEALNDKINDKKRQQESGTVRTDHGREYGIPNTGLGPAGRRPAFERRSLREGKRAAAAFREERRISHRRDQLKRLEEGEVCSGNIGYPTE